MQSKLQQILSKSSSWNQIYDQLKAYQDSLAGKFFEHFCKYYYLSEPTVASDYKNVWLYEETPHEIKKQLNLAKIDHGVDLILEDREGSYTVVQCKFRDDQSSRLSWTKDKIANLFAEADQADFITVFTNASDLDDYSKSKHAKKFHLVTFGELIELQPETIRQMVNLIKHKPAETKIIRKPHEHQITAIEKVLKGFQSHGRGQLILPCGAGKTLTALWIKEQLNSKHTLVIVPSLALLRQIKNEWHSTQAKWLPYLCVCSEQDIDSDIDASVVHTYELGGRVTTDDREICTFLNKHPATVIYSTYQSLNVISVAVRRMNFQFDLAVCDEAHKTAGSRLSAFGLVHNNKKVPVKKRLYMTATPRIVSKTVKDKLGEDKIKYLADMSDLNIFGPEFHRMSFAQAINKKILVDYQIIAIGVSDAEIQQQVLERQFAGDDETTIEDIANNYALGKVMTKYGATHAITFHSSIKRARQFKERHRKLYNDVLTDHVSGLQSTNDRNVLMNRFEKGSKAVMTNARCLTEGVDVPAIDAVYFCDPKNSKIDIVQASGRALRRAKHKNKKFGYIVVPIFHRNREKVEDTIESGAFKNLIAVVRALCDRDKRLVDEINRIKIGKGVRKPTPRSTHIKIEDELPLIVLENFEEKLKGAIFDQVIEKTADNWLVMYEFLKDFRQQNQGKWPNKHSKNKVESRLGHWCITQRKNYTANRLSKDRLTKLENINFSWAPIEERWNERFIELKEFRKQNPNQWPTGRSINLKQKILGTWCEVQRLTYKSGALNLARVTKLKQLGFSFDPIEEQWARMIKNLKHFRKENSTRWPSLKSKFEKEKDLASWCSHRRSEYKDGILGEERIEALEKIGFPWNQFDKKWDEKFSQLMRFRICYRDRWPSHGSGAKNAEERKLGAWSVNQRKARDAGKLDEEKMKRLDEINFPWKPMLGKWALGLSRLEKFRKENPTRWPSSMSTSKGEKDIGRWCNRLRKLFRSGQLDKDRIKQLNLLNFPWNPEQERWNSMIGFLKIFRRKNSTRWPSYHSTYPTEKKLAVFCQNCRTHKKRLNKAQRTEMTRLGFRWDPSLVKEKRWQANYKNLLSFRKKHPNRWPSHGSTNSFERQLGQWCQNQRRNYHRGELSPKQISLLKKINFPWDALENKWNKTLLQFRNYLMKSKNGLPSDHSKNPNERKLSKWLRRQRLARVKGVVNKNQLKQLDALYSQWHIKRKPGPKAQARQDSERYQRY